MTLTINKHPLDLVEHHQTGRKVASVRVLGMVRYLRGAFECAAFFKSDGDARGVKTCEIAD
jgi:hypothetical protein